MSARIDHAADARTILSNVQPDEIGGQGIADWLSLAQVHATLALVEQARTTNMQVERDRLYVKGGRHVGAEAARIFAEVEALDAQIREALGLS